MENATSFVWFINNEEIPTALLIACFFTLFAVNPTNEKCGKFLISIHHCHWSKLKLVIFFSCILFQPLFLRTSFAVFSCFFFVVAVAVCRWLACLRRVLCLTHYSLQPVINVSRSLLCLCCDCCLFIFVYAITSIFAIIVFWCISFDIAL